MNTQTTAHQPSDADKADALAELRNAISGARSFKAPHIAAAREAAGRLAKACLYHDNSQAVTVARALASIYNGAAAPAVRLDELRFLDWQLQRDLLAVMFGTGDTSTPDTHIREAFQAAGGAPAVEWFHAHLTETREGKQQAIEKQAGRVRRYLTDAAGDFTQKHPGQCFLLHGQKRVIEDVIGSALDQ